MFDCSSPFFDFYIKDNFILLLQEEQSTYNIA